MSDKERVFITGIGGQDGSILAELLCDECHVHGLVRRCSYDNTQRLSNVMDKITIHYGDITDASLMDSLFDSIRPKVTYHMADQDEVWYSNACPRQSVDVTFTGTFNVLEAAARVHRDNVKLFVPISATIFGRRPWPQYETDPCDPLSPYAACKAALLPLCEYYRTVFNLDIVNGIMYNHDSPRRRKRSYLIDTISRKAIDVYTGKSEYLELYDLDTVVDIGCAEEFMRAVWNLMGLDRDQRSFSVYNFGTSRAYSVGHLARAALGVLDLSHYPVRQSESPGEYRQQLINGSSRLRNDIGYHFADDAEGLVRERTLQYKGAIE